MINIKTLLFLSLCCSLKLECEKLATEKTEIQRHYVMVRDTHTHTHTHRPCLYAFTHNKCSAKSTESLSSANSCQTTPTKKPPHNHTPDHTRPHTHIIWDCRINSTYMGVRSCACKCFFLCLRNVVLGCAADVSTSVEACVTNQLYNTVLCSGPKKEYKHIHVLLMEILK